MVPTTAPVIAVLVSCVWITPWGEPFLAAQGAKAKRENDAQGALVAKEKYRYEVSRAVRPGTVTFSLDGKLIAARDKGKIVLWEASSGKEKIRLESNQPFGPVAFVPESDQVVGAHKDLIKFFDIELGREISAIGDKGFLGFLPHGKQFLSYSDGMIQVRDVKAGAMIREFRILKEFFLGSGLIVLSDDRKLLANVSTDDERTIKVWRIESGEEIAKLKGHEKYIQGICFSPSGKSIASTGADSTVRIWETETGKSIHKISIPDIGLQVAFSPNGKWLAVGSVHRKSRISILDSATGQELLSWHPESSGTLSLAFNPQSNLLASAGGRFVQVWEISGQKGLPKEKKGRLS